jgi:sugar (pentulose or hexulose) kinase
VSQAPTAALTLDLGTSSTKAALWRGDKLAALARAPIPTVHPQPGWTEQDPDEWWASVVAACDAVRALAPSDYEAIDALGFSAARETFALFDDDLRPLTPGVVWSDGRGDRDAAVLGDPNTFRAETGVVLNGACCAAKLAWVARTMPETLERARWILEPRNVVVARMTGAVVTDETLASRTGLCALDDGWLDAGLATYGERLPPIVSPTTVVGGLTADAARALGLRAGVRVIAGAGDRACEVLGVGASAHAPMVSWGTTANVSVPHPGPVAALPHVGAVSRGASGAFVVEAGLSAAGAAVAWLASLTGRSHDDLLADAATVEPGSGGLVVLPWFAGARGPWWRADANAAFVGVTDAHGSAELTRAVVEGIAFDVARCLDLIAPERAELALAGAGAGQALWRTVLAAVTGLPVARRAVDDAATVGARLIVARALGEPFDVDTANPVVARERPDPSLVEAYRPVRAASDAAAAAVLDGFTAP